MFLLTLLMRSSRNTNRTLLGIACLAYLVTVWQVQRAIRGSYSTSYEESDSSHSSAIEGILNMKLDQLLGEHSSLLLPSSSLSLSLNNVIELDPSKQLILTKYGEPGLANQLSCFQVAAELAVRYNRTLKIPFQAYLRSKAHPDSPARSVQQLFDLDAVPLKQDHNNLLIGGLYNESIPQIAWDPIEQEAPTLDPYPEEPLLRFHCMFAYTLFTAKPPNSAPIQRNYFGFHRRYQAEADRIYEGILERIRERQQANLGPNERAFGKKTLHQNVLGLHIRRGDRATWPVLDCTKIPSYPYLAYTNGCGGVFCSLCTKDDTVVDLKTHKAQNQLTWEAFMEHYSSTTTCVQDGFPVCASSFDAVFVASDDLDFVLSKRKNIPNLMTLNDFLPLSLPHNDEVTRLIVELLVLSKVDRLVPSFSSTLTDLLIRMRMTRQYPRIKPYDMELNETYWKTILLRPVPMDMPTESRQT